MRAVLPDFQIESIAPVSLEFRALGIANFVQAMTWVHALPYGRNADRADYRLLFREKQGTCSTKHAALAALCAENGVEATLRVAICRFDRRTCPGLVPLLSQLGVDHFPEAHCYLNYRGVNLDVTFPDHPYFLDLDVACEWDIKPDQIGEHKQALHRSYLASWLEDQKIPCELEKVWLLRERWISLIPYLSRNCS